MKTVSIISIVYGSFGLIWASIVSVMIRIQEAMMENFPWPPEVPEIIDMPALLDAVYSVIGNVFPFVFLIAALYIISGILQLSGKPSFKNLAYAAAVLNIIWYIAYSVMLMVEIMPVFNSFEFFPPSLLNLILVAGVILNGVFYCGYPIFLIIFLSRGGREWDTLDTEYTS
jgi:hypothetical protein